MKYKLSLGNFGAATVVVRPVKTLPCAKVRHLLDGYLVCTLGSSILILIPYSSWNNMQMLQTRLCCVISLLLYGQSMLETLVLAI